MCVRVGEKGLGRKRMGKKREGGGRGLVAIEACGWSPTCFVVVLVSHHTHPFPHHHLSFVLSCPSLVLFLFLPVCERVRVEGLGGWWIVSESPPTSPHHATTTIPRCPCCPSLSSCPFSLPFCPFLFLFFLLLLLKKEKEREVEGCGCTHHHCALWLVPRFSGVSQSVSWW